MVEPVDFSKLNFVNIRLAKLTFFIIICIFASQTDDPANRVSCCCGRFPTRLCVGSDVCPPKLNSQRAVVRILVTCSQIDVSGASCLLISWCHMSICANSLLNYCIFGVSLKAYSSGCWPLPAPICVNSSIDAAILQFRDVDAMSICAYSSIDLSLIHIWRCRRRG